MLRIRAAMASREARPASSRAAVFTGYRWGLVEVAEDLLDLVLRLFDSPGR
jgi:hypothetical protein